MVHNCKSADNKQLRCEKKRAEQCIAIVDLPELFKGAPGLAPRPCNSAEQWRAIWSETRYRTGFKRRSSYLSNDSPVSDLFHPKASIARPLHLQVPDFVISRISGPHTFLSNGDANRTESIVVLQVGKTPLRRFEVPQDVVPGMEDSEAASARDSCHVKDRNM